MGWIPQRADASTDREIRFVDILWEGKLVHLKFEKKRNFERIGSWRSLLFHYEIVWQSRRLKGTKFRIHVSDSLLTPEGDIKDAELICRELRKKLFKNLRMSLAYGFNMKARKMMDTIAESNNKPLPHQVIRASKSLG